ncbi:uncharacterized protein LOC126581279 [Anopheles aquasalis]|uniref:uncharacterized protein LOC126581279 n=1 Tax=Anopheles aquasalis TaxID=42839 RepID=UPI00215B37EA|nr:uncharacterized protein LOC126581279 [Anopheles aquasalis]
MAYYRELYKHEAILAICRSERLLSKHQEMLESIFAEKEELGSSYWLARISSPVVAAIGCAGIIMPSLLGCSRPSSAVAAVIAVPVLATIAYNTLMYKKEFLALVAFMNELDAFDTAATRVFVYYDEISSYEHELLRATATRALTVCVRGMRAVAGSLYDLGRSLESFTDLAKAYEHVYGPLEGREYFYESNVENSPEQLLLDAKKRRKVLLYLQSMCLYRWGLAIASGSDLGKARITLFKAMTVLQQSSKNVTAMFLPMPQESTFCTSPASKKVASLKARALAVTTNLTATQQILTTLVDTLQQVANDYLRDGSEQLKLTAGLLSAVRQSTERQLQDIAELESDVARLISPNGFNPKSTRTEPRMIEAEEDIDDEITVPAGITDTMFPEDEFFLHTESALDSASTAGVNAGHENEEPPVEQVDKSTQRNYRTVLKQLHGKLQPINQEFKVREQRALQRKGITASLDNVSVGEAEEDCDAMSICSFNSDDDDLPRKRTNYQQRYQDAIEQLAAKPQINLFPSVAIGFAPAVSTVEENILE